MQFKAFDDVAKHDGDYGFGNSYTQRLDTGANSIAIVDQNGIDVTNAAVYRSYTALTNNNIKTLFGFTEPLTGQDSAQDGLDESTQIASSASDGTVLVRAIIDFLNPTVTGVPLGNHQSREWRKDYTPADQGAFFTSYIAIIERQAMAAQVAGAQHFDIGTEFDSLITPDTIGSWTTLIQNVRAVFKGQLTYSASWSSGGSGGSLESIPAAFWRLLDDVGIDAYGSASDPSNLAGICSSPPTDPTLNGITQGKSAIDFFDNEAGAAGKPLTLTEFGYTDASDAATNPLEQFGSVDDAEQAALYQAFFTAWDNAGATALVGAYDWDWNPNSDDNTNPTDVTPRHNPDAISTLAAGFSAPAPDVIVLDGGPEHIDTVIADTTGPVELVITPHAPGAGGGAINNTLAADVYLAEANTSSGGTLIEAGTACLVNRRGLGRGGLDVLAGTPELDGNSVSFPTLRGGGTIEGTVSQSAVDVVTVESRNVSGSVEDPSSNGGLEIDKIGSGTLGLSGVSGFYTATDRDGGTLEVGEAYAAGASEVVFGAVPATLIVDDKAFVDGPANPNGDGGTVFPDVIANFQQGDTIDLTGIGGAQLMDYGFGFEGTPTGSGTTTNTLDIVGTDANGITEIVGLQFDIAATYPAELQDFPLADDGSGGTLVTVQRNPSTGTNPTVVTEIADLTPAAGLSRTSTGSAETMGNSSLEKDYDAGTYAGSNAFHAVTGQTYTGEEVDVSAASVVTKAVFTDLTSTPYSFLAEDFSNGAPSSTTYGFTNQSGKGFTPTRPTSRMATRFRRSSTTTMAFTRSPGSRPARPSTASPTTRPRAAARARFSSWRKPMATTRSRTFPPICPAPPKTRYPSRHRTFPISRWCWRAPRPMAAIP